MKRRHERPGTPAGPNGQSVGLVPGPERATETPDDLLDVLGDDYTREAIDAIRDGPKSGGEVAAATSMSKPTAFRRLNELAELGLVEARRRIDPDGGHHHKVYHLVVDSLSVSLGGDDLAITVEASDATDERGRAVVRSG